MKKKKKKTSSPDELYGKNQRLRKYLFELNKMSKQTATWIAAKREKKKTTSTASQTTTTTATAAAAIRRRTHKIGTRMFIERILHNQLRLLINVFCEIN